MLHGCVNTRKYRAKFKNFQILLDSECNSTIVMAILGENLHPEKYAVMKWYT